MIGGMVCITHPNLVEDFLCFLGPGPLALWPPPPSAIRPGRLNVSPQWSGENDTGIKPHNDVVSRDSTDSSIWDGEKSNLGKVQNPHF